MSRVRQVSASRSGPVGPVGPVGPLHRLHRWWRRRTVGVSGAEHRQRLAISETVLAMAHAEVETLKQELEEARRAVGAAGLAVIGSATGPRTESRKNGRRRGRGGAN